MSYKVYLNMGALVHNFPLVFGGIISVLGFGFLFRASWMGDIEGEKRKINREDPETVRLIKESIQKYGKGAS